MAKQGDVHVMYKDDRKKWVAESTGGSRAIKVGDTKAEVEKAARAHAKRHGAELIVHGKDGKIQRRDSHGADPRRSKG